jgi:peptidoglycan/xylan/chitin deacetylase (PgdA/CDA1 family)
MSLTVVMYHYVRDLERSRYPRIKGLPLRDFRVQLRYLLEHYRVISVSELLGGEAWPFNAALLTFDDGFADHYTNVFPLLDEAGVQGLFFPPAMPLVEGKVLDVHKIHSILAAVDDVAPLVEHIRKAVGQDFDAYWKQYAHATRFDPAAVIFVKRMLQVALDEKKRGAIADELFRRYVSADEAAFSAELYMNSDQLRCMIRNGMYVGSHGYSHAWLTSLAPEEQAAEINRSLDFLRSLGAGTAQWTMSYPYGDTNDALVSLLKSRGCAAAFTTEVGVAEGHDLMLLPRLDTNDLPPRAAPR